MPRNLARYEQFLRLDALVDTLANSRHPLDDTTLITAIRERLGLTRLSPRTLHRDCDFLIGWGYPLDRIAIQGPRRNGWSLNRDAVGRIFPAATSVTILELIAFNIARDLLQSFEGTVLWSGIESLRTKLDGVERPGGFRPRASLRTGLLGHTRLFGFRSQRTDNAVRPEAGATDLRRLHWRRDRSLFCCSLCAAGSLCRRMRPTVLTPRPLAGWRQTRTSVGVISCFKTHRPLRSVRFLGLHRYYEAIRLLLWHRTRVVAFLGPTVSGPEEISWGKNE